MPMTADVDVDCCVTSEWLLLQLREIDQKFLVILDCRSSNEYGESHIRDAVNFSIPSIMLRRLATGKIDLVSTIKSRELKNKICSTYKENLFVLYNDDYQQYTDSVVSVLLRRLTQDGCRVVYLKDGFSRFKAAFPEWCDSCSEMLQNPSGLPTEEAPDIPLLGLQSLRISSQPQHRPHRSCDSLSSMANSSTESSDTDDRCDSSLGLEDDRDFPVEILPYLFLGNAANSEDSQALARHSIQYVLNVTPNLRNVFEDDGNISYLQIPIEDHWSQNLESHFPKAIEFIDEARSKKKGVLVHCLAGISRSVTITVAYLMYKCQLNLNDAFNLVRSRKSNIAPNFHFLRQLHNYEQQLKLHESSESPVALIEQLRQHDHHHRGRYYRPQIGGGGVGGVGGGDPRRSCPQCGHTDDCKCRSTTGVSGDFLSPMAHLGVSPDSGIEFDRWSSSNTPGE
ncbi:dual specificity protein phosphatase Mpk3 [Onthophagus taurus]|uniref:dual specificity protein phosphatase Mpk3 n=1 Tax=Onthophagus taurus TaxID=166361 RepID=UPI000C20EF2D|nr:dual specificity protein phosphatase Mpk3 [Onthophagus taurus]